MTLMLRTALAVLLAAITPHAALAQAQTPPGNTNPATLCAADANTNANGSNLSSAHLMGDWIVEWSGGSGPGSGRLTLKASPDHADSLEGRLDLGHARRWIAGDVDEGLLTLEESPDAKRISANWSLRPDPGPCGPNLAGQWIGAGTEGSRNVRLLRPGRW